MKDLDAASMTDVQEWFKTNYGPNNVTLVLAGDITPEVARQKVEKYYGDIPAGPPLAKHEAWIAKRTGTHRGTVQDRVPQARLYRVWNVPGRFIPRPSAAGPGRARTLGGGKTSQASTSGWSTRTSWPPTPRPATTASEIGGQFDLTLTARPGRDVRQAGENRRPTKSCAALMKVRPDAAELDMAKTAILARYTRIVERVGGFGGKSDLLASCATYTGNPSCYKDYLKAVHSATPQSVRQAMAEWLSDGDYVLEVQPYPTDLATTAPLNRAQEPALGKPESLQLPPMQRTTLSNGLKVVVAERHAAPVVNLSMLVDSGYASDSATLPGLASLALRLLEEGTTTRGALKISEGFESIGANYGASTNLDGAVVQLNALKATLPVALDLYADVLLHPAYAQNELDRLKKDRLAAIQREISNPSTMAMRVIPSLVYGKGHAYALPFSGSGTAEAVTRITRDDLMNYHRTWFKPNNATMLVVGNTTLAEIKPQLERAFGGWKPGDVPKKNVAAVAPAERTSVYLMDKPGAQQSIIYAVQLAPPRNAAEALQLQVVNNIFGGAFSSRINMNLREDKHWSYGVRASLPAAVGQRMYISMSPVQTDKTREALQELVQEYANVAGVKPITAGELSDAQSNETLALPGSFETAGQLSGAYAEILQYGLPEDYYNTYTNAVLAMTPDQANALASRIITPGRLVWVVVGDMSKVEAGVRGLNLGEVRKIDAEGKTVQ